MEVENSEAVDGMSHRKLIWTIKRKLGLEKKRLDHLERNDPKKYHRRQKRLVAINRRLTA